MKRIEREQEHSALAERDRVEALARALLTSRPDGVPVIAEQLRPVRERVLPGLRAARDEAEADPDRRLRAAVAMGLLGEDRPADLIAAIPTAPPPEGRNVVLALAGAGRRCVEPLRESFRDTDSPEVRTRFAVCLLAFGELDAARSMLLSVKDPTDRAAFIHYFPEWHGDLDRLSELLRGIPEPDLRSGLCLALGRIDPKQHTEPEIAALTSVLLRFHAECPDGGTHSAAGWALRRWGIDPPAIAPAQSASAGRAWSVNRLGMTMIEVPAGPFPTREAYMLAYALSACEVTVGQFRRFLEDPNGTVSERPSGFQFPAVDPVDGPESDRPMTFVSWEDAVLFCNWLSRTEGRVPCYERAGAGPEEWRCRFDADGYRLPTRAECEYAMRAGSSTTYPVGPTSRFLHEYANIASDRFVPVGRHASNRWGLFDLQGNLWESIWESNPDFPMTGLHPIGPSVGPNRLLLGGAFNSGTFDLTLPNNTFAMNIHTRIQSQSFRVARAVRLSRAAVAAAPDIKGFRSTLGVVLYRDGDWAGAVDELERSVRLDPEDRSYGNSGFVLAMAYWRRGDAQRALMAYDRSVAWMAAQVPDESEAQRFRAEAEALIGTSGRSRAEAEALIETSRTRPDFRAVLGDLSPSIIAVSLYRSALAHGRSRRWREALRDLSRAVASGPGPFRAIGRDVAYVQSWYIQGPLYLQLGDVEGYDRYRRAILEQLSGVTAPVNLDRVSKVCLLTPVPVPDVAERLRSMAATARRVGSDHPNLPWFLLALGLAEYRSGHWDAALKVLDECREQATGPLQSVPAAFVAAMALGRLGRSESAQGRLAEANWMMAKSLPAVNANDLRATYWPDWLICAILAREAEAVVLYDPVFPADPFAR